MTNDEIRMSNNEVTRALGGWVTRVGAAMPFIRHANFVIRHFKFRELESNQRPPGSEPGVAYQQQLSRNGIEGNDE